MILLPLPSFKDPLRVFSLFTDTKCPAADCETTLPAEEG